MHLFKKPSTNLLNIIYILLIYNLLNIFQQILITNQQWHNKRTLGAWQ